MLISDDFMGNLFVNFSFASNGQIVICDIFSCVLYLHARHVLLEIPFIIKKSIQCNKM